MSGEREERVGQKWWASLPIKGLHQVSAISCSCFFTQLAKLISRHPEQQKRESKIACLRGSEICYCLFSARYLLVCDRQSGTRKSTNFHGPSKTGYFRFPLETIQKMMLTQCSPSVYSFGDGKFYHGKRGRKREGDEKRGGAPWAEFLLSSFPFLFALA